MPRGQGVRAVFLRFGRANGAAGVSNTVYALKAGKMTEERRESF